MADEDKEQKTEQPTARRLQEAQRQGNVAFSREVTNFLLIGLIAIIIIGFAPGMMAQAKLLLSPFLANADEIAVDARGIRQVFYNLMTGSLLILIVPLAGPVVLACLSSWLQNGFIFSAEPMTPSLNRLSPIAGFKRMFSLRSLIELIKNLFKIGIILTMATLAVVPNLTELKQLPNREPEAILALLALMATHLMIGMAAAMFFIAIIDFIFQRFQHFRSLRMSKQEIKDEWKQTEGDPVIKGRLRRLRMERARQRMIAAVPTADVVITNPTHFAVALKYDSALMRAPKVIAKGQDLMALRMREIAEEHKVPVVENPPLARALFSSTEVDEEIPTAHYEAVAKIISYVYKLKGKRM